MPVIVPIYGYVKCKMQRLRNLAKNSLKRECNFSDPDEIGANVIALDAHNKKLLYLKKTVNTSSCLVIDLKNIDSCSIKKEYTNISAGALKTQKLQNFLKGVFLSLRFKNGGRPVILSLYEAETDSFSSIKQVEVKAKKWMDIVSKYKPVPTKEIA